MDDDVEQMDAGELKHEHRKLAKKLREIRELAARERATLNSDQLAKLDTRAAVDQRIAAVDKRLGHT